MEDIAGSLQSLDINKEVKHTDLSAQHATLTLVKALTSSPEVPP